MAQVKESIVVPAHGVDSLVRNFPFVGEVRFVGVNTLDCDVEMCADYDLLTRKLTLILKKPS